MKKSVEIRATRPELGAKGGDLLVFERAGEVVDHKVRTIEKEKLSVGRIIAGAEPKSPFATLEEARAFQATVFEPIAVKLDILSSELLAIPYGKVRLVERHGGAS